MSNDNSGDSSNGPETIAHHYTDDPWCDWCDQRIEDGEKAVVVIWEFPSSDMAVEFCSDECATEWDCSKSKKERKDVVLHG